MFQKYPSLENHYREKFINACKMLGIKKWIATEKIHGANFQLFVDKNGVKPGSRSQFVDGTFYNCQPVIDKYTDKAIDMFKDLQTISSKIKSIAIYGELFGGMFEGKNENHAKAIQKGVDYIPFNDFMVFDIRIDYSGNNGDGSQFHDYDGVLGLANAFGFKTPPIVGKGTLKELLELPNDNNSLVPGLYGLKHSGTNTMEGLVIRPYNTDPLLPNGSRPVIKSKNEKWSEKQKIKTSKKPANFTHPLQPTILEYINTNRLETVLSKIGGIDNLTPKDFGKLLGMYSSDVFDDLIKDEVLTADWKKSDELKPLGSWVTKQVKELLMKEVMTKI